MGQTMMATLVWNLTAAANESGAPPEQLVGLAGFSLAALGLLCTLAAIKAAFVGMAIWFYTGWPRLSERVFQMYRTRGRKCFWVGAINTIVGLFVAILMIASGKLVLIGILLLGVLLLLAMMGYSAAYRNLGQRLISPATPQTPVRAVIVGGAVAELAFIVPVLGQILSIGVLFRGVGASVLVILGWRRDRSRAADGPVTQQEPKTPASSP